MRRRQAAPADAPSSTEEQVLAEERTDGRRTAIISSRSSGGPPVVAAPAATDLRSAVGGGGGRVARWLSDAFLPVGYPSSVSPDYLSYQVWDSVQGLCSYVRGMLSSQAILAGVGVGSAAATPLGAVFQFFVRDFAGMLGGIVFASSQGAGFDAYAKQWRLFADVMNNVGLALELASPLLPSAFLLLACLGSVARAVTGVAGGATRMALTQHFALQRNAADIAAKEGSQETAVTLVGMLLGMALIRAAAGWQPLVWAAFLSLTALHVYANIRAMRSLHMTSINAARLSLLLRHYLCTGEALSPAQVAAQESLVPPPLARLARRLRLGGSGGGSGGGDPQLVVAPPLASLAPALQQQLSAQLQRAAAAGSSQQYLAAAGAGGSVRGGPHAVVLLREGAGAADTLEGCCLALLLAWKARLLGGAERMPLSLGLALADPPRWVAAGASKSSGASRSSGGSSSASSSFRGFEAALMAAGWAVERVALMQGQARLAWGPQLHRSD